jgi:hypothetical protein
MVTLVREHAGTPIVDPNGPQGAQGAQGAQGGGGGGGGGAVLAWGDRSVTSSTQDRILDPWFENRIAPLLASGVPIVAPRAGTLRNLFVRHHVTAGNGSNIVYTVQVNGVDTSITVTLASTATQGSDTVNTQVVAGGDRITLKVTKAADIGTSPQVVASVELS